MKKPLLLCILDGFGWVPDQTYGNAILAARTPNLDKLFAQYPYTTIGASGMNVGLPDGQMGNSEVGHTNIGAGRIVYQELTRITKDIQDGGFFENPALLGAVKNAAADGKALHLIGLLSNGGVEAPFEGEDRALIPSPKVATYDLQPEMSAYLVADECVKRIESDQYDVIILNFANCDMVGHTGVFEAAVKAVEAVDACAGKVIGAVLAKGGAVLLTADHGNADKMYDPDPEHPFTAHTTNPVPFLVAGVENAKLREGGVLADIAPTMLKIMGLPQPEEMTGKSILE